VLMNTAVMKRIAKLYKKDPKRYPDMSFLPLMIMTMIQYYSQPDLNDDEKEIADKFDIDALTVFCENILKKEIRSYARQGLTKTVAFQMAAVIPTAKILKGRGGRWWYKRIVDTMYRIAEDEPVDVQAVLTAIRKVDKKKIITSAELRLGFYSEFLMTRSSNKVAKYNNDQKELYDTLISQTLEYLNDMKASKLREVLRAYIKRRKYAEEHKNDSKRVIKFVDHANSNSPYSTIKSVVQDLISDNSNNELYLS
jgi:hypothetical protein